MKQQREIRRLGIASAVTLALLQMQGAAAQTAAANSNGAEAGPVQAVVVTGSLIRRAADEGALPVTSVKATELEARGHTELKDLVLEMPQSLSLGTNSGSAGPIVNLRGLGPMRTLTLLNGRRLANEPLQDQYVSVNVIPRMALDRADTLRDGASSIYGADAIGGVQNFWTKRGYKGISAKVEYNRPEASGGGDTKSIGAIAGWGDLRQDGWNAYIALDYQEKDALFQGSRPHLFDPDVLQQLGLGLLPDNRNPSPIANFGFSRTANSNYNPAFASGCLEPYARPTLGAGSVASPATYSPGCYRNPLAFNGVTDDSKILNLSTRASWNVAGHRIDLDIMHSEFMVGKVRGLQVPAAANGFTSYVLPSTSRFYPGNGITPAVQVVGLNDGTNSPAMYIDPVKTPGVVGNLAMNNRPIYFSWGPAELGSSRRNDNNTNDRIVLSAEGTVGRWDYRVGANIGESKRNITLGDGYIRYSLAQEGFNKGILNPFGLQDAEGLAYLESITVRDYSGRKNKAFNRSVDATVTREVWALPGGPLTLAISGELRRDAARTYDALLDYVTKRADGSYAIDQYGTVTGYDIVGEVPSGVARKIHRDIKSLVFEAEAPVTESFSLNGAVRADRYDDLKTTTVNPKLSARWQPLQNLVLRSSVSTGFRAPTIMDMQNSTPEVRTQLMDDPVLCPSRTPTVTNTGTPVAGYTRDQVCDVVTNYWTKSPNASYLKPEESRSFSVGGGWEPVKNLSITVDWWGIKLTDILGAVTLAEVQQNPAKYANQIVRGADGLIDHLITSQANRGDARIRGFDISTSYRFPVTTWGTFDAKLDGTYYQKYEFQAERDGPWLQNIGIVTNDGRFGGAGPNAGLSSTPQINPRWKHTASVAWRSGPWRAQLSHRYTSSLKDVTPRAGSTLTHIDAYSQFNVNATYSGFKNVTLSFGINNLNNTDPSKTSNSVYNGYLTSMADILGRAYKLTAEYKF
jgi:iron complex outermembrane receptor protein